jgi:hypothetical protein
MEKNGYTGSIWKKLLHWIDMEKMATLDRNGKNCYTGSVWKKMVTLIRYGKNGYTESIWKKWLHLIDMEKMVKLDRYGKYYLYNYKI